MYFRIPKIIVIYTVRNLCEGCCLWLWYYPLWAVDASLSRRWSLVLSSSLPSPLPATRKWERRAIGEGRSTHLRYNGSAAEPLARGVKPPAALFRVPQPELKSLLETRVSAGLYLQGTCCGQVGLKLPQPPLYFHVSVDIPVVLMVWRAFGSFIAR